MGAVARVGPTQAWHLLKAQPPCASGAFAGQSLATGVLVIRPGRRELPTIHVGLSALGNDTDRRFA